MNKALTLQLSTKLIYFYSVLLVVVSVGVGREDNEVPAGQANKLSRVLAYSHTFPGSMRF